MHFLDIALIVVFLAANIIVGFWSRGQNQSFTEYAIGDKKFSTPVLTATIVATWMSGSVFFILLTVFGFKTSLRVVFLAMGAGFVTVVSCLLYFQDVNSFFPGMLANLVVMLGAHYGLGEEGGWGHNPLPKHDFIEIERPAA